MLTALNGDVGREARPDYRSEAELGPPVSMPDNTLRDVISLINENALAQKIGIPVDSARAAYSLETVLTNGHEVFNDIVTAFVLHLFRRVRGVDAAEPAESMGAEAFALLERTFAKGGGVKAAMLEAQNGTKGGIRYVLDAMTEQFKKEEREKEVHRVLMEALDPLE